ncbi:unnamed protein product [Pseudo-nitzschia multistriata]|uniref:Uncharacterized protein n=1 Tax=Pseudo-nitzschia multistriata TaxID=183589 RepID=A0A448ZMN0_9STRA|nr:unnamed protein product [Pseudo-nitzschia multistriata]
MRDIGKYASRLPSPKSTRGSSSPASGKQLSTPGQSPGGSHHSRGSPMDDQHSGHSRSQRSSSSAGRRAQYGGEEAQTQTPTAGQLMDQLEEARARDASARAALTKSDAVIMDLRSNQRQLKRQLELLKIEKADAATELQKAKEAASGSSSSNNNKNAAANGGGGSRAQQQRIESLQAQVREITQQLEQARAKNNSHNTNHNNPDRDGSLHSREDSKNARVGELQVQLDRAHAQILTADMVRKELEDTLEAEQYTWELRVQDQERQIAKLQQDAGALSNDLEECRSRWKEAEAGWNEELGELRSELAGAKQQLQHEREQQGSNTNNNTNNNSTNDSPELSSAHGDLLQKIHQLESERAELQSCLDEALKELEAVDDELRVGENSKTGADDQLVESLQHLLRWVYQEGPVETRLDHGQLASLRSDPHRLVSLVQEALEGWLEAASSEALDREKAGSEEREKQKEAIDRLEGEAEAAREELSKKQEVHAELRESLREAVSLLKPLQDAVAAAEEEKKAMQRTMQDLERDQRSSLDEAAHKSIRISTLEGQVSALQDQLKEEKRFASVRESLLKAHQAAGGPGSSTSDDSESLASIKRAREELRRKRESEDNLQKLLKDAQSRFSTLHDQNEDISARNRELEGQIRKQAGSDHGQQSDADTTRTTQLTETISLQDEEIRRLRSELDRARPLSSPSSHAGSSRAASSLERELEAARGDLAQKEHANTVLNKSLKEALGLLKPLQMHLEAAEMEKNETSKELRNLRKRFRQLQMGEMVDDQSRSTVGGRAIDGGVELAKIKEELEETVRQLELENSELHDALDDLTEGGNKQNNEAKTRHRLVELNSLYEVTQNQLEDARVENHALLKALRQKEAEEIERRAEVVRLGEQLHKTESELTNAKKIAQSALVKVEELTMSNIEQLSILRDSPGSVHRTDRSNQHGGFSY